MKSHKIRVIKDGSRFYPQCKFKHFYEYFLMENDYPVYFNTIQGCLDYMSERLYEPNKDKKKVVYRGDI